MIDAKTQGARGANKVERALPGEAAFSWVSNLRCQQE